MRNCIDFRKIEYVKKVGMKRKKKEYSKYQNVEYYPNIDTKQTIKYNLSTKY
jgi:hypothetical protein